MRDVTKPVSEGTKAASTSRGILGLDRVCPAATKRIDPKWVWHYRTLLGLRDRLLNERGAQLADAAETLEPHSMDLADSATDAFDHDMALSQMSAKQDLLFEIDEALKRILNGSYGVCEETGKAIPKERLKAIPWTRFIREVEARLEHEGGVSRLHLGRLGSVRDEDTRESENGEFAGKRQPLPVED